MGMSTGVEAFKPPNEKWRKMKQVWDTCGELGVPVPEEVYKFFNGYAPDEGGVRVALGDWCRKYNEESREGYEIDVTKLPEDVTVIRFVNSW